MFRKCLTLILAVLALNFSMSRVVFAETKAEKEAVFVARVKANVAKLGTGKDSKIQVKLKDGTKIKGYLSQINENNFVVTDEKSETPAEIPYANAKQVKGNNLNSGVKILIGVAIVIGVLLIIGSLPAVKGS